MLRRFQGGIGGDHHLGLVFFFQLQDLLPLVVEQVLGDVDGESAIDPDDRFTACARVNPA